MDDLHLEILKLRDRVGAIQRTQDYAKEKSALLQKAIESNNNKTTWVSVIQIGILLVTGVYQAKYLQKYFHKKKLV
uniref:GOLD domain-containing protein n=1 Tax=Globisporangium ultimum (strain ATCC 200006 / CBS 805.95 / DAOM BR144) TaxID=431595 RepID=K3X011_GLOUD